MASKMLLIITYSSMVFWLILSVTCKQICLNLCLFFNHSRNSVTKTYFRLLLFFFVCVLCLTVTRHSSSLRQRLFRLSDPSPQTRPSSLSIKSCTNTNTWNDANAPLYSFIIYTYLLLLSSTLRQGISPHTFILCSALSKPMSMLMMSKPDADLFFWWTPRKSAQRVWERSTEVTKRVMMMWYLWHKTRSIYLKS